MIKHPFTFSLLAILLLTTGIHAQSDDASIRLIKPEVVQARLEAAEDAPLIIDVREPSEFEAGHIDGALLAPLGQVENDVDKIAKDREIVLVCRSARRSGLAYQRLAARGFTNLYNMEGGMLAWEKLGFPVVTTPAPH